MMAEERHERELRTVILKVWFLDQQCLHYLGILSMRPTGLENKQ